MADGFSINLTILIDVIDVIVAGFAAMIEMSIIIPTDDLTGEAVSKVDVTGCSGCRGAGGLGRSISSDF